MNNWIFHNADRKHQHNLPNLVKHSWILRRMLKFRWCYLHRHREQPKLRQSQDASYGSHLSALPKKRSGRGQQSLLSFKRASYRLLKGAEQLNRKGIFGSEQQRHFKQISSVEFNAMEKYYAWVVTTALIRGRRNMTCPLVASFIKLQSQKTKQNRTTNWTKNQTTKKHVCKTVYGIILNIYFNSNTYGISLKLKQNFKCTENTQCMLHFVILCIDVITSTYRNIPANIC